MEERQQYKIVLLFPNQFGDLQLFHDKNPKCEENMSDNILQFQKLPGTGALALQKKNRSSTS